MTTNAGNPGSATSVAITQFEGELQVTVNVGGKPKSTIRKTSGAWTAFADITAQAGSRTFSRIAMD